MPVCPCKLFSQQQFLCRFHCSWCLYYLTRLSIKTSYLHSSQCTEYCVYYWKKLDFNSKKLYLQAEQTIYICTCKEAIQCRPWATPPLYCILLAKWFQIYLPFWNPKDNRIYLVSRFFLILKIKDPFLGKKSKNVPNCGVVALFVWDYCNSYTEKVWRVWSFFPFLKKLGIDPFMIKKPKPRFFEFWGFGHFFFH